MSTVCSSRENGKRKRLSCNHNYLVCAIGWVPEWVGESPRSPCLGVTPFGLPWLRYKFRLCALLDTRWDRRKSWPRYRLKKDYVRCEVRFDVEETAEHQYRLRDTVFAVRYALRSKKQLIKSVSWETLCSLWGTRLRPKKQLIKSTGWETVFTVRYASRPKEHLSIKHVIQHRTARWQHFN